MKNNKIFIVLGIFSILLFAGIYLCLKLKSTNIISSDSDIEQSFQKSKFESEEDLDKPVCREVLIIDGHVIKVCELQQKYKDIIYKNSIQVYPVEARVKVDTQKFHTCGNISDNRRFCMNPKRGIQVDFIEEGQYLWYILDLYLLDNENKLIAKYNNAIITCCDVIKLGDFLPVFEGGKASILLIKNDAIKKIEFDIDRIKDTDTLNSSDIVEVYINKDGNLYK